MVAMATEPEMGSTRYGYKKNNCLNIYSWEKG